MELLFFYSCIALPLWAAQFALYFFLRSAGRMKESLVAKCAGSFLAVGSAALGLLSQGELPSGDFLRPRHVGVRRGPCVFDLLAVGESLPYVDLPDPVGGRVHPHRHPVP